MRRRSGPLQSIARMLRRSSRARPTNARAALLRYKPRVEIVERRAEVAGIEVAWREAPEGGAPILYVHGVPTASWDWIPFLERTGGFAPDLPGFGSSDKPADFDYSIAG